MVAGGFYQVLDRMWIMNRVIIIIVGALFWQCSETKEYSPEEFGTDYFPLQIGTYRIYQVDGAIKNFADDSIGFSYLLKECVIDSFQNLESGISYIIDRQKKYNENDPWETDSIWTARIDAQTAVRVEHNVPVVSLTFPLEEHKTWDGNKLNGKHVDEFEMINVGASFSGSFESFKPTVTVIQEYFPDPIVNYISRKEVFCKNKGLIYKENIILNYKEGGLEIVETSLIYFQHLIEYGEE